MSKQSEAVKSWRNRTKTRIVESMGGKCYICSYNKCNAALDLHHIDPNTKIFSMGGLRANPVAWSKIVEELRKCILLCANCHREVEDGFVILNNVKSTFDESFAEYVSLPRKTNFIGRTGIKALCVRCNEEFIKYQRTNIYCSDVCRHITKETEQSYRNKQRPRKTAWPEREELKRLREKLSYVAIGKMYGVSDSAVRKWTKSYKLI